MELSPKSETALSNDGELESVGSKVSDRGFVQQEMREINAMLREVYTTLPDAFRDLVSAESRHLGFMWTKFHTRSVGTKKCNMYYKWESLVRKDTKHLCDKCLKSFGQAFDLNIHHKKCAKKLRLTFKDLKHYLFSLNGQQFACQLGCELISESVKTMIQHLVAAHNEKELAKWKINSSLIKKVLDL